jgi:hypothetical protein
MVLVGDFLVGKVVGMYEKYGEGWEKLLRMSEQWYSVKESKKG